MNPKLQAALKASEQIAPLAFSISGVHAVTVRERVSFDPQKPSGHEILIHTTDIGVVEGAFAAGTLPREVVTPFENIPVIAFFATFVLDNDNLLRERPIQPGASFGSESPGGPGTYGARITGPGGYAAITAGHVVGPAGARAYQPAPGDRAIDGTTYIGDVVANPLRSGGIDAALVGNIDQDDISATPHYTPEPSRAAPAAGLYVGRNQADTPDEQLRFIDFQTALVAVGGSLPAGFVKAAEIGQRVIGSGRSSGIVEAEVVEVGTVAGAGAPARGFMARRIRGGQGGDSGTVVVLRPSEGTICETLDTGETLVAGYDDDTEQEWLNDSVLAPLLGGQAGRDDIVRDLSVTQDGLGNIVDAVKNTLKRLLGDLSIQVTCLATPNRCSPEVPPPIALRTSCVVEISRNDGQVDRRPAKTPAPKEPQPVDATLGRECRTFGLQPVVSVSGDDKEEATISLELTATVSIRLHVKAEQRVSNADFNRVGTCWAGRCGDRERISGSVIAHRTTLIEVEATAGSIRLPGLGKIEAGKGAARKESTATIRKEFTLNA